MEIFNYKKINKLEYINNKPFPHIQLDNCWENLLLKQCNEDIYKFNKWYNKHKWKKQIQPR